MDGQLLEFVCVNDVTNEISDEESDCGSKPTNVALTSDQCFTYAYNPEVNDCTHLFPYDEGLGWKLNSPRCYDWVELGNWYSCTY